MLDQISLRELLQDPIFKAWMRKPPKLIPTPANSPPWILYVRMGGKWKKKEYGTYPQAFNSLAKLLKHRGAIEDAAIHSKRQRFKPPVVSKQDKKHYWPCPPDHQWCPYCRRPTRFQCFKKHHNFKILAPWEPRCTICGLRQASAGRYPSKLRSRFQ